MRKEAREWLSTCFLKEIKFANKKEDMSCSVPFVEDNSHEEYYDKINVYLATSFSDPQSMSLNNFGNKYKDFAEAAKEKATQQSNNTGSLNKKSKRKDSEEQQEEQPRSNEGDLTQEFMKTMIV